MAWQFNNLKYGWMILASITLGTTIYIINNERQKVRPEDIVEIMLGTYERCLATQYQTNPPAYYVAPPSFVRSWYSNSYETTNMPGDLVTNWAAVLHTNIFTNVFGVRLDHEMLSELDNTIKALVPYYCDANTVYDGTTNVTMLTVTGLWASLYIGDRTNQFTAVPEWVGTNGVTNAATFGDYPWRIYKQDLEERYKVLNALKKRWLSLYMGTNFGGIINNAIFKGNAIPISSANGVYYTLPDGKLGEADNTEYNITIDSRAYPEENYYDQISLGREYINSPFQHGVMQIQLDSEYQSFDRVFSANVTLLAESSLVKIYNSMYFYINTNFSLLMNSYSTSNLDVSVSFPANAGSKIVFKFYPIITFPFQYCTNKYW